METGRPPTIASNGIISTPHYLASQAGLRVLRDGGNAVDAAIAANAVLTVVMPDSCSIGGDLFAMIWDPEKASVRAINASGRSAKAQTADVVRSAGTSVMPDRGPFSVTVPGAVSGWQELLDAFGSRELGSLLDDAILYAAEGYPVTPRMSTAILSAQRLLLRDQSAARQFLDGENVPRPGRTIKQPALATSLRAIAREGVKALYEGQVGNRIVDAIERRGGVLTLDDLAGHRNEWVDPLQTTYRGLDILEMPPNTQGITALQLMNIAEGWNVTRMGLNSVEQIHHFIEAKKLAFADRDKYVSDPEFVDVPIDRLNSKAYAAELRSKIDPSRASLNLKDPAGSGGTIYLCVFDQQGMGVSLIQSVFKGFGSGIVAEGTGIVLQNRGASFTLEDGAANQLQPSKRPMHTLIPGMVLYRNRPWCIFGTQGGHGQAQTHLQLLTKMIDFGLDPQRAIESPRWLAGRGLESDPEHLVRIEEDTGESVLGGLRERGHEVLATDRWNTGMGHSQAIRVDWDNGVLVGGADPRADGYALGW